MADAAAVKCENCSEEILADEPACPACGRLRVPATCERHPERQAEYQCALCGRTVCDECDHPGGRTHLCESHREVPVIEGWAQVYTTSDDIGAQLIVDNLQAEGMEARVLSQKDHYSFTVDLGDLSPVRVLVPAYEYEAAEALIREHMDANGEVAFACPTCGEAYEPGSEACPACGAALPAAGANRG